MLHGGWHEIAHNEMKFNFPDPLNVFPAVLKYLYSNKLDVNADAIPAVVAIAEQMQISTLKVCSTCLSRFSYLRRMRLQ